MEHIGTSKVKSTYPPTGSRGRIARSCWLPIAYYMYSIPKIM